MRKSPLQSTFYIFVFFLSLFIIAFINVWNNNMTGLENNISDLRWLYYAVYLLAIYSGYIWMSKSNLKLLKGIHVVCVLWCILMPIVILINHGKFIDIVQTILWPLLFEASYLLTHNEKDALNAFRLFFIFVAIYGGFYFIQSRISMYSMRHIQSNTIYFVFLTLPWLLLVKGKNARLCTLIIFTIFGVWSLKRSIMLALVFIWATYILTLLKGKYKIVKLSLVVLLIVGGIAGFSYGDQLLGGELSERINQEETDEGRNRLAIYTITWNMIQSSSTEELIFGHGHYGVLRNSILEISAHNDFLEVVYDYGLIIFILYLFLCGYIIRKCIFYFRSDSDYFMAYATSLYIFFVMSMVGHLILYTTYFNYLVIFWGSTESFFISKKKVRLQKI